MDNIRRHLATRRHFSATHSSSGINPITGDGTPQIFPQGVYPSNSHTQQKAHFLNKFNAESKSEDPPTNITSAKGINRNRTRPSSEPSDMNASNDDREFYGSKRYIQPRKYENIIPPQKRHFTDSGYNALSRSAHEQIFPSGGKRILNLMVNRSGNEMTDHHILGGRIKRLSEKELHQRAHSHRVDDIEYTKDFYKMGACRPVVAMDGSHAVKSMFSYICKDYKSVRSSLKLQSQNRKLINKKNNKNEDDHHDEEDMIRKRRNYRQVAAENAKKQEEILVASLPDIVGYEGLLSPPKDEDDSNMDAKLIAAQSSLHQTIAKLNSTASMNLTSSSHNGTKSGNNRKKSLSIASSAN